MTQEELLERAEAWLALPYPANQTNTGRVELNALYQAITGKAADCSTCNNWLIRMAAKVREYVANPERFTIQPTQTEIMANKSTKYRISKAAKDNGTELVVINQGGISQAVNLNSMSDEEAEAVLASDRYKHNVEEIPTKATADEAPAKPSAKSAPKTAEAKASAATETNNESAKG